MTNFLSPKNFLLNKFYDSIKFEEKKEYCLNYYLKE